MQNESAPQKTYYNTLDYRWRPIKPERRGKYQLEIYRNGEWQQFAILARKPHKLSTNDQRLVLSLMEGMMGAPYTFNKLTYVAYSIARKEVK